MFHRCTALAATALLLVTTPALAAGAAPAATGAGAAEAAVVAAPVDPARIKAARQTVDYVFPLGTYARMMNGTLDKVMDTMMESMSDMPLKELAGLSGVDTTELGSGTMKQVMEIYDPVYQQRMKVTTRTMMAEMSGLMTEFEPEIRDGLAQAYAARFDTRQLDDLNTFFATPTGKAYAAESYMIFMAPEVMAKMQAFMPRMMQQMPAIIEKTTAATAALPKPRSYADLTTAEKTTLAGLLGVSEDELARQEAAKAENGEIGEGGEGGERD